MLDTWKKWLMEKLENISTAAVIILFQPNFLWMFPVTGLTNITYRDFEILTWAPYGKDYIYTSRVCSKFWLLAPPPPHALCQIHLYYSCFYVEVYTCNM